MNTGYLSVRLGCWAVLGMYAILDYLLHRNEAPRGWQLHRIISIVLFCFVIQDAATSQWARFGCLEINSTVIVDPRAPPCEKDHLYNFMLLWYNVTKSLFLAVLLLIGVSLESSLYIITLYN